jgi:hypothetical protein
MCPKHACLASNLEHESTIHACFYCESKAQCRATCKAAACTAAETLRHNTYRLENGLEIPRQGVRTATATKYRLNKC